MTFLYKTYGILGKVVDIPVDDAYKNGGFDLDADSITEDEVKDLQDSLNDLGDIEEIKTAQKMGAPLWGRCLIALSGNDLSNL